MGGSKFERLKVVRRHLEDEGYFKLQYKGSYGPRDIYEIGLFTREDERVSGIGRATHIQLLKMRIIEQLRGGEPNAEKRWYLSDAYRQGSMDPEEVDMIWDRAAKMKGRGK
jgi:hypothetical protein